MVKKILVILGHPSAESFNQEIADTYAESALKSGFKVRKVYLNKIKFNPVLWGNYSKKMKLEPALVKTQEDILWADHLVFVYPIWWTSPPAILKGFIERTFLPGFAFKYHYGGIHDKLLKGKTASLIMTTGGQKIWYFLFGWIMNKPMSIGTLGFCGIKVKKQIFFSDIRKLSQERIDKILGKARILGEKGI